MSIMTFKFASILPVVVLIAACNKHADDPAKSAAAAPAPSEADAMLSSADKATYTRELNPSLDNLTDTDWKTGYQTTVEAIANWSTEIDPRKRTPILL